MSYGCYACGQPVYEEADSVPPQTNFELVREFHDKFCPDQNTPDWNEGRIDLRLSLINEEWKELQDAIFDGPAVDKVATADALTDLLYVIYGAGHAFGIDLDTCFREVHRSNMSKLGVDGKPILREDGKVLKGPNFSPPSLEAFIHD